MQDKIEVNGISFHVVTGKNKGFWALIKSGEWEPETFDYFSANISAETVVFDVGAWIGPTALYAAQIGAKCIALEPDPVAFAELQENVQANRGTKWIDRLSIINAAVTADGEPIPLGSRTGGGDSMTSALFADEKTSWVVPSRRLPDLIKEYAAEGQRVFLKIDIEGGEYDLIPAIKDILARQGVRVHLSLHPRFLRKALRKKYSRLVWPFRFLAVRRAFVQHHRSVIESLPSNKSLDFRDGPSLRWLLAIALLTGRFPKDVRIV